MHQIYHATTFRPQAVHPACNADQIQLFFVRVVAQPGQRQYLELTPDEAAPLHADALDEERDEERKAAIERAAHEPAIQAVLVSAEGASHPRQEWDCHDHRPGQLPKQNE